MRREILILSFTRTVFIREHIFFFFLFFFFFAVIKVRVYPKSKKKLQ